jgi:hypothetical protein
VLFTWTEILPAAIHSLSPLHQELVGHFMESVYTFLGHGITIAADLEP